MKNKQQKVTNKEIMYHIGRLYNQNGQMGQVIDGVGNMFYSYLEYKGEKKDFSEYCQKLQKKQQEELAKEEDEQNKQT